MARQKIVVEKPAKITKKAREAELLAQIKAAPLPEDDEARKSRLKTLIKLGKERGFLTYAEINDHLPDDVVDAEQIETLCFNSPALTPHPLVQGGARYVYQETPPHPSSGGRSHRG